MQVPDNGCPVDYRYPVSALRDAPETNARVLYVVGGLYGNTEAMKRLGAILRPEPEAVVVFNGDFNWFNTDRESYLEINEFVLSHTAIRGNVETELAHPVSRGCGCAYPEWVDPGVIERSDHIIRQLKNTARRHRSLTQRLATLPRFLVYRVAGARIGIVHGDAGSLSGWGFSQEHLARRDHLDRVAAWFTGSEMDVFACSHTCLPVLIPLDPAGRAFWVVNNGAAGMPNFRGLRYGLVTRIADRPCRHVRPVYGVIRDGLFVDAIALEYDHDRWLSRFLRNWPAGSAAHESYYDRIISGPEYTIEQAYRG